MVQRRGLYFSMFAAGAATLVFAFNNCSSRDSGVNTGSASLASSTCKINPDDQMIYHQRDGDHDVTVYASPEDAPRMSQEKLYFHNTGDAATAPRWKVADNNVPWYYNPTGAPSAVSSIALQEIQNSLDYWSSVCGIKFTYMGTTTKGSSPGTNDGMNVFGWGTANGATGITGTSLKGTKAPLSIAEADIQLNSSQVRSATFIRGVMNHELGHFLGLIHSDVSESIMFANPYHDVQYLLTFRKDDIDGCVGLYGTPGAPTTTTPTPTPTPRPSATPMPTATPVMTPAPTATPRPSATPVPTVTPPRATPTPTPGSNQPC